MSSRTLRQSPSGRLLGAAGFARLKTDANVAYTDGVDLQVPLVLDDMTPGFGEVVTGGALGTPGAFRLSQGGIYLVTAFMVMSAIGTTFDGTIALGVAALAAGRVTANPSSITLTGNLNLTQVVAPPGSDLSLLALCNGASGILPVGGVSMLIVQVG